MATKLPLPPGQKVLTSFPRFGLPQYADRFPKILDEIKLTIDGDLDAFEISEELQTLPRVEQTSDFHCVTTWSKQNIPWSGWRFRDFYEQLIKPKLTEPLSFVIFKTQDGFMTSLPLEDLLKANVILADKLDGQPLSIEHGAPIRIIAPDHYGYKNPNNVDRIYFHKESRSLKKGIWKFIDHPRARVANEERARLGPGWMFRRLYGFTIKNTISNFEKAMKNYRKKNGLLDKK